MRVFKGLSVFLLLWIWATFALSSNAQAAIHSVPGDYGSIQVAIYVAESGDTIQVAAGTYTGLMNRNLDLVGKQLAILGAGPDDTILDCGHSGRGFLLNTGQTSATVIDGFGIINGQLPDGEYGGGVFCEGSSPVLRNLRIESCRSEKGGGMAVLGGSPGLSNISFQTCVAGATYAETCHGGGLYCTQGAHPTLDQATFADCVAEGSLRSYGGAIRIEDGAHVELTNTSVSGGSAGRGGGVDIEGGALAWSGGSLEGCSAWSIFGAGGGLYCREASTGVSLGEVEILNNTAAYGGGGALFFAESTVPIDLYDLNVTGNTAEQGNGGGLQIGDIAQPVTMTRLNVENNTCSDGDGAGLYFNGLSAQSVLSRLNVWGNRCLAGQGAGLFAEGNTTPLELVNSFIAYNLEGGALCTTGQNQLIVSCGNLWENLEGNYLGDLEEQTGQNGNLAEDPLFCDVMASRELVGSGSPMLAVNNPCGEPIGLYDCSVGCDYILEVPTWFDGIQDALDVAMPGDTIRVLPGTYTGARNKNLSFHGKDLVLLGVGGAEKTIIDCEHDGRGMNFVDGETSAALVQGFTITHGYLEGEHGGGVQCFSDLILRDLILSDNTAMYSGGISIAYGGSPTIENTKIIGNLSTSPGGGGVLLRMEAHQF